MHLRCAQCEHEREVVVGNAEAERFDEALDRRADPIARTLHRLDVDAHEAMGRVRDRRAAARPHRPRGLRSLR